MAQAKTTEGGDVAAFLADVQPPERQAEALALDAIFRQATGFSPRLWAGSMVGYGRYAYRYDSGHSGVSLATGFAPRKAELVVYILPGYADFAGLLARLGPHRLGKSCLYLRRLQGIDTGILAEMIRAGLADLSTRWTVEPT
jgi:hypothetical protein